VTRKLVGGRAVKHGPASASAMGRFETEKLARPDNLAALADLPRRWIDAIHDRRPPKSITLDMDSSGSPVHGNQEGSAWNGHFRSKCLHPLFVFKQLGDLERCSLRPGRPQCRRLGRCAAAGSGALLRVCPATPRMASSVAVFHMGNAD